MSSILWLDAKDFTTQFINNKKYLFTKIRGISIVLFYSDKCPHCPPYFQLIKTAATSMSGYILGFFPIRSQEAQQLCKGFISGVPSIIIFVDGQPSSKYEGSPNLNQFLKEIDEMTKRIAGSQKFIENKQAPPRQQVPNNFTPYGIPYCKDGMCYKLFNDKDPDKGYVNPNITDINKCYFIFNDKTQEGYISLHPNSGINVKYNNYEPPSKANYNLNQR